MKKITSKQQNIKFIFCPSPVTIDKSSEWGEGNLQQAPNGAFLKMNPDGMSISHLVQPNEDKSAPIGWRGTGKLGNYDKKPIWIDEVTHTEGFVELNTKDGRVNYEVKEPCMICYNDNDGEPDKTDGWVQKIADIKKNYYFYE